jgi:CheY-like chemotaxis protein
MPAGGTLTIATRSRRGAPATDGEESTAERSVMLEVIDTGGGIARELLPHIFDPFFTTKPIGRGTGLGLAAVAGTVRSHGGTIEVDSELGRGTAFRVYLPCTENTAATRQAGSAVRRGSGEILLVDDDAMVSVTAINTLKSFGYAVTHAPEGKVAIELVRSDPERFCLVLLDLRMPGLSGEQTFDALREISPKLRVMIWSGYGADQDVAAMLRRGAVGFVQKPYRVAELSHSIAEAIDR